MARTSEGLIVPGCRSILGVALFVLASVSPLSAGQGLQAEPARTPDASATISGVVSSHSPAEMLAGAEVTLSGLGTEVTRTVVTGETGAFVFDRLAGGRYVLSARRQGFSELAYGATRAGRSGIVVVAADGQHVSGLTIALPRLGSIAGIVMKPNGTPLHLARVVARRVVPNRPLAELAQSPEMSVSTATNAQGGYHLTGLAPGAYRVRAYLPYQTTPDAATALRAAFHPDAVAEADGTIIALAPGEDRQGVHVALRETRLARISGTLFYTPPDNPSRLVPIAMPTLYLDPEGMGVSSVTPDDDGRFEFTGVPPGTYAIESGVIGTTLFFLDRTDDPSDRGIRSIVAQRSGWARTEVRVDGDDVTGVPVHVRNLVTVRGRLIVDAGEHAAGVPAGVTPELVRTDARWLDSARVRSTAVGSQGEFHVPSVIPGRFRVEVLTPSVPDGSGWFLKRVTIAGRDVTDVDFEIAPDQPIDDLVVTVTRQTQQLTGTLLDETGRFPAHVNLLAFPVDPRLWVPSSRRVRLASRATDGSFEVSGLPAGDYYLVAIPGAEPENLSDPAFLEPLTAGGIRLTLAPGEHRVQDLRAGTR